MKIQRRNHLQKLSQFIFILFSIVINIKSAHANGLFFDISYIGTSVTIAEQEFKPTLLQAGIGWQFTDRFSLQLSQASSETADSTGTVDNEIETMSSVFLRYGSPVSSTVNVYMMLGHSDLNLVTKGVTVDSDENFAGTSWGFGFEERVKPDSNFRLHFDYIVHYKQDELTVDSLQLGVRYVF